jgi:bifunctional DNase/RNase
MGVLLALGPLAQAGPAKGKRTRESPPQAAPTAPKGFVEMQVAGVMPTREGTAVVLRDTAETVLLPIWIGDAEAFSIQMRLDRRRFQRPLTHDLLDAVMRELGGRLVKVHVDDLKGNTFVGTIYVAKAGRTLEIDSRPSDAIALAVGNRVPIFVSQKVLDRAGVKKEDEAPGGKSDKAPGKLLEDILKGDREEHTL